MKGVSAVIATILILMISISMAGLGYMTFSEVFSKVTTAGDDAVSSTISTMLAQMKIDSISVQSTTAYVYIRNTGKVDLTGFSAFADGFMVPSANLQLPAGDKISPGELGVLNITGSLVSSGSIVKISSAQGTQAIRQAS